MDSNNQQNSGFSYTYSAKEQAEIKKIREKYQAPSETEGKMDRLRKLDAGVTKSAEAVALVLGVIGTLVLGLGMSLFMTELGEAFFSDKTLSAVIGILIGVVGGILAGIAYPIYNAIVKAKRKKLAPEILKLTDELLK